MQIHSETRTLHDKNIHLEVIISIITILINSWAFYCIVIYYIYCIAALPYLPSHLNINFKKIKVNLYLSDNICNNVVS